MVRVAIEAVGEYDGETLPAALPAALAEAVRKHMCAYGLAKVEVGVVAEDDRG